MKVSDIVRCIEDFAPPKYQESYDNSGLLIGNINAEIDSVLLCIDVTEEVVFEAIEKGCGMILAHHPIIFKGLKRLTSDDYVQRTVVAAIKSDIAVYAAHTNADAVYQGVNMQLARKLGLSNIRVLDKRVGMLKKLFVYVPAYHVEEFRKSLFETGAGTIGDYDQCSFNIVGQGTFRPGEDTNPFVGKKGEMHLENEVKIEIIFPAHLERKIILAIKENHPYEEPAYDIIRLDNEWDKLGIGMIGELQEEMSTDQFLLNVKETLKVPFVKYTKSEKCNLKKVAVCGGSGAFLIKKAMASGADVFVTADVKYHEFFDAENKMMIVDAGHYETEQFTKELFYNVIHKKFPNFAVQFSNRNTNPVNYY
jgi:dinuclear metal center YbgI/SA1388 family protein